MFFGVVILFHFLHLSAGKSCCVYKPGQLLPGVRIDCSVAFISKSATRLPGLLQCLVNPVFIPSVATVHQSY